MSSPTATLRFEDGAVQFRQRIIVSLLSMRPLLIRNIRHDINLHDTIGIQAHEACFLRLIDKITNGTKIEINSTGTQLRFFPGILIGSGQELQHECSGRAIGYFLEGILPLAPFGKEQLHILFKGSTEENNDENILLDPSPDYLQTTVLPLMQQFGIGVDATATIEKDILAPEAPHIRIVKRGNTTTGLVELYCPMVPKQIRSIDLVDTGLIKRIRGTVFTYMVSNGTAARVAYTAKGIFHRLLPDVWIHTSINIPKDKNNRTNSGSGAKDIPSVRFLVQAETTTGVLLVTESIMREKEIPEDFGQRGAIALLELCRQGGIGSTVLPSLALLWMCVTPEDVSRIRLAGPLSAYTVESLRLFKKAFGVEFKVKADQETKTVVLSCLGTGYRNMARAAT